MFWSVEAGHLLIFTGLKLVLCKNDNYQKLLFNNYVKEGKQDVNKLCYMQPLQVNCDTINQFSIGIGLTLN